MVSRHPLLVASMLATLAFFGAACGSGAVGGGGADASTATDDGGVLVSEGGETDAGGLGPKRSIVHGDYAGVIRDVAGNVDAATTIARLAEAHVDTYAYLIFQKPQADWDALPAFLDAAQAKGIRVWVYLVPPTEVPGGSVACTGDYPPYQLDYVMWAKQIATLATTHPNLTAFAIDDFVYNTPLNPKATCKTFSAAYVAKMVSAAHAIAPDLGFWPVGYYPDLLGSTAVMTPIRSSIAGVIFPFRDGTNSNTYVTASAEPEIKLLSARFSCARDFKAAATRGRSGCFEIAYPWGTPSAPGAYASAAQTITVGAAPHDLTFSWQHDFTGKTSGYVFAQVVVDGTVVWEADIGTVAGLTWHPQTVSLDTALAGKKTAQLELRVTHKNGVTNFGQAVDFDEVQGTGIALKNGDFESGIASWSTVQSSATFIVNDVRTTSLVTMVYAATLSSDKAHPPTADYVKTVLGTGLDLAQQGYADGTMTYVLDKRSPDTDIFTAVTSVY